MCVFIFSFSDALPKPVEWVKFVKYHVNHSARHFRCVGPTPFPWHAICYRLYLGTIAYHEKGPEKRFNPWKHFVHNKRPLWRRCHFEKRAKDGWGGDEIEQLST